MQRAEQETLAPKRDELQSIEKLIQDTETEAAEVARGFARVGGGLVGRKLEEQVKEVEARYAALTKRRDELNAKLSTYRLNDENLKAALRFREDVIAGLQGPTSEDKRRILEILGVQVTIKDGQAQIRCAIPTSATIVSRTSADRQLFRGGG